MDNRLKLEALTQHFSRECLTGFLRAASGKFGGQTEDLAHYLDNRILVTNLLKLGTIDFDDGRRLIALAGQVGQELSSQSGKLKQFEIARKVLKGENYDAGIFVFYDTAGHFRFSLINTQYKGTKHKFSSFKRYTYFVSPDQPAHTFVSQIGKADFASIETILEAFSVEPVTKEFYKEYEKIFRQAEASITLGWSDEQKRLYTQRFFNRLLFLAFLERKGWMNFMGRKDYLCALFEDYQKQETDQQTSNFHRSRLNSLFFWGLNNPRGDERNAPGFEELQRRIGQVPYLNGGLFEEETDDQTCFFPDAVVNQILENLVYHFNFTVSESTPMDIEVAVDPEMLGKIFEELVTGRHESGSYYTPKPIVAFMCREALKGYLASAVPGESEKAIAKFVDESNPAGLRNPETALTALRTVKVCDPACGSGAYLLGMMHQLLEQRECLFAVRALDKQLIYDRKLEIIQNNLYGVDKDNFAVNIARLRLWLSLIVDFEGDNPPPLPNLDFKIEPGDSLTAPDPSGGMQPDMFRQQQVQQFLQLKNDFMSLHAGQNKKRELAAQINALRSEIKAWAHPKKKEPSEKENKKEGAETEKPDLAKDAFDWQVDFAEIFSPELAHGTVFGKLAGIVNTLPGQLELTAAPKEGGFDIVLANPPYVRHELLGGLKELLKPVYPEVYNGTADLYVYFFARAHQLLRKGGVACFISSNKWLRAGYGEKLREHLLDKQAFLMVVDFGDLPVFQSAMAYPCIFLWQKLNREKVSTKLATVSDLQACYDEGLAEHISTITKAIPFSQFGKGKPRLIGLPISRSGSKTTLRDLIGERRQIYSGIKTGLNEVFVIDKSVRDELVSKQPQSQEILKPLLIGEDIRSYEYHFKEKYLIWTYQGVPINRYNAILEHLGKSKEKLEKRTDTYDNWYELRPCDYYQIFNEPKIIYPQVMKNPRFYLDELKYFTNQKCYLIPIGDWFILGILNSDVVWQIIRTNSPILQGGYSEPRRDFMLDLPIPDAPQTERETVARLAEQTQNLHTQRRARVEQFLRSIGVNPAQSTSRNPLEQPWTLEAAEFERRAGAVWRPFYEAAREETAVLTGRIEQIEVELDQRVKSLYGL